jgi:SAM-dependent methyltransferase
LKAHDVRQPPPWPDGSFDAVYSHMLFNMALSTPGLDALVGEVRRVLRPEGLHVYTVRHVGDAHFGAGIAHGDGMFENGGFIVHFFDLRSSSASRWASRSLMSTSSRKASYPESCGASHCASAEIAAPTAPRSAALYLPFGG